MLKAESLYDLTGYESGVIIYKGGESFVTNWSGLNGLPKQFITGFVDFGEVLEFSKVKEVSKEIMEIALALAEQDQKENGVNENPSIDEIFENEKCYIFTLNDWN